MRAAGPIWLVTGVPGAGKTSVAIELCRRYPKAVHLPVDDLRELVVAGFASPLEAWTEETELQFKLARRAAARAARDYADRGFAAVLDDVIDERYLGEYEDLRGLPLRRVLLHPSLDVALARNALRANKPFDTAALAPITRRLHPGYPREAPRSAGWFVLDSGALTVAATVDALVARFGL